MKRFLPTFLLITLVLAIYPFVTDDGPKKKVTGLPWQVDKLPDGGTRVFGLVPGGSTFADAAAKLGDDHEIAVMEDKDGGLSLEMFFERYRAGLLSGKLVLLGEIDRESLASMRDNAAKKEVMESLARKYWIDIGDRARSLQARISHIAFIPAVNLDEEIVVNRFGATDNIVQSSADTTHYLYPELGLDIAISAEYKDVLQYVAPADFAVLTAPLRMESAGEDAP